jgi:hypothetical protein
MAFFVECQIEGHGPSILKEDTREEMHELIELLKEAGAEDFEVWGADEWHLRADGKIYNTSGS